MGAGMDLLTVWKQDSTILLVSCSLVFSVVLFCNCFPADFYPSLQDTPSAAAEKIMVLNISTRRQMGKVGGHGARDMKGLQTFNTTWELLPSFDYSIPGVGKASGDLQVIKSLRQH